MSSRVSRGIPLPYPIKLEKDAGKFIEKQGIVSILGSEFELINKVPPSLRRTISADMSSKKWLAQNGFSQMKKIASFGELSAADHEDQLNVPGQDDVWRSIQLQKEKNELENPTQLDVWSSILAEKTNDQSNNSELPPPYIHPLVKRSSSILSQKSLEICTESLGSETGSESFSSHPPSETDDIEDAQREEKDRDLQTQSYEELKVVKYNYKPSKKMPPRSFPPPLPSLARGDGPSLHMQSQRENGRLVLQAVSVPQRNYFNIERQQGRLLLTLVNCPTSQEPTQEEMRDKAEVFGEVFNNFEQVEKNDAMVDEEEEEEEEEHEQNGIEEMELATDQSSSLPSGVINEHRSTPMMKSLMGLHNKDPTWSNKLNRAVESMDSEEPVAKLTPIHQSLPPTPMLSRLIPSVPSATASAASSFNAYEYFWRNKPTMASIINPISQQCTPLKDNKAVQANTNTQRDNKQNVTSRNCVKGDAFLATMRGCKESRRSLLFWQPYCVATS